MRSHSTTDRETWFRQKNLYKCLCRKKSNEFWDLKLFECKNKSVITWKYINEVAGRGKAGEGKGIEIGSFKKYLDDKIGKVKSVDGGLFQIEVSSRTSVLDEFLEVDEEELMKVINNLPNKQCALVPITTWLLKRIASLIAPFLVSTFNSSFKSGTVPQGLKLACVTPILKKTNLNQFEPSSYRLISNVPVLSKILERLGVFMDRDLSMNSHTSKMLQAGFSAFRQIRSIKKCLSYESLRTLAVALILSRIDYFNTLLAGLSEKQLCRVQSLINTTARLSTGTRKFDHKTPVLKKLHWVKVRDRVVHKILLLIFKCKLGYGPKYISERLIPISAIPERRKLRSSNSTNLYVLESKMSRIGKRRFEVEGPSLWNSLPEGLRRVRKVEDFGKGLKSSFFFKY